MRWAADHDRACVDVVVSHRVFRHVSEEARTQLTFLLLDHALGEQAVETWIGDVTSVADLTEPPDGDLADLAQAVERFADAHAGDDGEPAWRLLEARAPSGQVLLAMAQVPLRPATMPHLDTHVRVELPYYLGNDAELPVDESLAALRAAEDGIAARLGLDGRVVAHETTGGLRTLHVYVDSATDAVERVRAGAATWPEGRPRTVVSADPAWQAVGHLRG